MLIKQAGFSLLEVLLTMALSGVLMTSAAALLPELTKQHLHAYRQYRLEQTLRQALFKVEKDLRRAGFIRESVIDDAVKFYQEPQNARACLIIRYDLNRNGKIEGVGHSQSELFGYRLTQGALEQNRGAADCSGGGWEKIIDPNEIKVTEFSVETQHSEFGAHYFTIYLGGHWQQNPRLKTRLVSLTSGLNL